MNTMEVNKRGQKWQARYRWRTPSDKKQHTISKSFTRKSDAESWWTKQKIEHLQGMNQAYTTFIWVFDHYYNTYKKDHLRENTHKSWNFARKHVVDYFGKDKMIQKLSNDDYQQFINSLNNLSHSSVKLINQCCTQVLEYAVQ